MKDDGTVDLLASLNDNKITNFVKNDDGLWGNASGDNKTVFTLKETAPTDEELADSLYTRYEVEFNITDHRYFMFYFKEKSTYYVTYSRGKVAMGAPPLLNLWRRVTPLSSPPTARSSMLATRLTIGRTKVAPYITLATRILPQRAICI